MSSSASSSKGSSPAPEIKKTKRKRKEVVQVEDEPASDSSESSESEDEAGSGSEEESTKPEEPVLSHAERRRQKKEAKLAEKLKEEGLVLKKRKLKDGSAKAVETSTPAKRQNSVWVGNMSFKTTQDNLRTFFEGVGEITRINMPTKSAPNGPGQKPENRGFAYVDFATPEAKTAAIALSENPLLGRKLLIKDGGDFAGRPAAIAGEHAITDPALAHKTHSKTAQKILRAQKQPPAPTLFLGNLGFETTEASIRELLEAHRSLPKKSSEEGPDAEGEDKKPKEVWIRKVRMGTFEDSGLCKGFAFVDFMTVEHATSALINPKNHHLDGRKLVVEYASADAVRRGAPRSKQADATFNQGRRPPRTERPQRNWEAPVENTFDLNEVSATAPADGETAEADQPPRKKWDAGKERPVGTEGVRHKGPKSRPKPGAALALAKRESAAIVPNQGRKITF